MPRAGRAAAMVLSAGLLSAAGDVAASIARPTPAVPATAESNEAAARADAASLLASLSLPSGAVPSSTEPAGDGAVLSHPGSGPPVTPNAIDQSVWWVVPGTPSPVLSYIDAHPPAGSVRVLTGSGTTSTGTSYRIAGYARPAVTGVLSERWLIVEVTQLQDGSTGLRADAQVVWLVPRPASEHIAAGARRLRVSVTSSLAPNRSRQRPIRVTNRKKIRAVVALLNSLPAAQPGVHSCPADFGTTVRLVLYPRRGRAPLAIALVNPSGCGDVRLSLGGRPQPLLASAAFPGSGRAPSRSLIQQIDQALGVTLDTGLPNRSHP